MTQLRNSAEWRLFSFNWGTDRPDGRGAGARPGVHRLFAQTDEHRAGALRRRALHHRCLLQCARAAQTRPGRRLCAGVHRANRAHHPVDDTFDLYFRGRRPADARRQPGAIGPGARARLARLFQLHLRAPQTGLDPRPRLQHHRFADLRHSRRARTDAHHRRLHQFILAFTLALIATTIISVLVPAIGTYDILGIVPDPLRLKPGGYLDGLRDLPLVRDGSLRELDMRKLGGIITFPSFHAGAAVLYL